MNDPDLEQVREWLARDPIRPSDAPTQAGWLAIHRRIKRRRRMAIAAIATSVLAAAAAVILLVGRPKPAYIRATADLEAVLRENRSRLRPETVRAVEHSLTVIDSALAQAEQALAQDPANEYVIRSIDKLKLRRFDTLRDAVALAQE